MYEIKIRAGHSNGPVLTQTEAVFRLMGIDERNTGLVYVTPAYTEDTAVGRHTYKAGEAVFGLDVEVYPREIRFGQDDDAKISIGGSGAKTPEVAEAHARCYMLAIQIAATANAAAAVQRDAK